MNYQFSVFIAVPCAKVEIIKNDSETAASTLFFIFSQKEHSKGNSIIVELLRKEDCERRTVMKMNYFEENDRVSVVIYDLTEDEKSEILKKLPQEKEVDSAWLKPIEIYRDKFLNGPYAGKTVQETLTEAGDAGFLWISMLAKSGRIQTDKRISSELNGYLMARFINVDDAERYIHEKDEPACDALIRVFSSCVPAKILAEAGCSKADEVLRKPFEVKKEYLASFVRFCQRLAKKYAH